MKMKTTYQGQITSVEYERKSSFIKDFGVSITGDIIASQLDGGDTKNITGFLGGIIVFEVYENNFADEYTKLTV
jgi:hypothetical protein